MPNGINLPINELMQAYGINESVAHRLRDMIITAIENGLQAKMSSKFDLCTIIEIDKLFFTVFAHIHEGCKGQHCKIARTDTLQQAQQAFDAICEDIEKQGITMHDIGLLNYHAKHKN